jgi:predicted acyl esterase
MKPKGRISRWCVFAVVVAVVAGMGPAAFSAPGAAAPPAAFDYSTIQNLSEPQFDYATEVSRQSLRFPVADGEEVYIEITRPTAAGQYPVILEASPYHGTLADREGTRILPEPRDEDGQSMGLTRYFAPRGYAVVMMDLRGTGLSSGCLDHIGPKDRSDMATVIEWLAVQPWSNGRVGMAGHSYVAGTQSAAAAMRPNGLVTIVPSAGLAGMYDHQFQAGVPYFLQWAGPIEAYEQLALQREIPIPPNGVTEPAIGGTGEHFGKDVEDIGCGLPNSSLVAGADQLSGRYAPWHAARDWEAAATAAPIPIFMVHGVNDNAARVTGMEWFTRRGGRPGDKLWLGQWDHGSGCCPTRRGIQWTFALHAWFDRHLAQRDVDTGPPAELFLSDGTFEGARAGDRTEILLSSAWPHPGASTLTLYPTAANRSLSTTRPPFIGSRSYTADPLGFVDPQATGGVDFATAPMAQDTVLAGQPQLDLVASVTMPRVHVIATLYDESPPTAQGVERRRISQFAINPELRNGIDRVTPVVPGAPMTLRPPGFAMAHNLRAGHRLVLRVTASDPDKVPMFAVDLRVTVYTGPVALQPAVTALRVPVVPAPVLVPDTVPFDLDTPAEPGEAQAAIRGSVTPTLGAPLRVEGLTSAFFEFDVEEGNDNAVLIASAVPSLPADIDLYLQRRRSDGTWSGDLTSGGSSSLTEEQLRWPRPAPGRYRIEVHNWAGLPSTRVDLTLTFVNSAGVPGP